ncbi:MAG: cell wall biosynthesis glycosyltransferase [Thermoplasmatales archaeon A-plasma]|nr:MAG: cell wall biosynthesis glycosyltransferase [Thermoplasmatales archaeon A-plasma]
MKPYISVIVTAYNRKEFLEDSLRSLLRQTLSANEFEVILITNFEYDIDAYHNLHIKQYLMEGTAWEFLLRGIELSNGEIISFLDDDDIFMADKLKNVMGIFRGNPDVDYYRHNFKEVDRNLKSLKKNSVRHVHETKYIASSEFIDNLSYLTFNEVFFNASTIVIRKKMINVKDGILQGRNLATDFMLWILAVANAREICIDKKDLSLYRIHKGSTIHSDKGEEKYSCKQDDAIPFLTNYKVNDKSRKIMMSLMTLKSEVNSALFCGVHFTIRHYFMNLLLILLSDNRFKATLVLLKKMMLVRKPIIIKMLKNEQNIIKFLEKFVSFFKLTQ